MQLSVGHKVPPSWHLRSRGGGTGPPDTKVGKMAAGGGERSADKLSGLGVLTGSLFCTGWSGREAVSEEGALDET